MISPRMLTADCTIYVKDGVDYRRHNISGVHWRDRRGVTFSPAGAADDDSVYVIIPLEKADLPVLSRSGKKQNYIIRGVVVEDVTENTLKDLLKKYDVLTITQIIKRDYSLGAAGNHWGVYAK